MAQAVSFGFYNHFVNLLMNMIYFGASLKKNEDRK